MPRKFIILAAIAIFLINFIVFFPSFDHVARMDHLGYLIETAQIKKLPDIIAYSYSYPRHRLIASGDQILFRPLLFTFISLEKWMFGYNFFLWQVTGLFLHLGVLFQVYRLLRFVNPHPLALLFVLNFSVLLISCDMVIWSCVNGYMIFLILFFQGFLHLLKYFQNENKDKNLGLTVVFLTLSCFFFDFGVIASGILFLYCWIREKFSYRSWILSIPVFSYVILSLNDYLSRGLPLAVRGEAFSFKLFFGNLVNVALSTLGGLAFPAFIEIEYDDKLKLLPLSLSTFNLFIFLNVLLLFFVISACVFVLKKEFVAKKFRGQATVQWISLLLFFFYAGVLSFGRSAKYLSESLYHYYFLAIFFTIFAYCLCLRRPAASRIIAAALAISIVINVNQAYRMNLNIKNKDEDWGVFVQKLEHFVKLRENENDFSFTVMKNSEARMLSLSLGNPEKNQAIVAYDFALLFPQHVNLREPKYFLVYDRVSGLKAFRDENLAQRYIDAHIQ